MTDDLRDRIAAVLIQAEVDWLEGSLYDAMADAVIRELGLEREHWQYGDGRTMGIRYRYVTEWQEESNG